MVQDFSTHCQFSSLYVHMSAIMKIIEEIDRSFLSHLIIKTLKRIGFLIFKNFSKFFNIFLKKKYFFISKKLIVFEKNALDQ